MNVSSPYVPLPRRLTVAENLRVYGHPYGVADIAGRIEMLATELGFTDMLTRGNGNKDLKRPFSSRATVLLGS